MYHNAKSKSEAFIWKILLDIGKFLALAAVNQSNKKSSTSGKRYCHTCFMF